MIRLNTFDKKKNKIVKCGYVEGNTYFKDVNNKHYMFKYNGYGIQEEIFKKLVLHGTKYIQIKTKAGTLHTSDVVYWIKNGKVDDFGHGKQIFLDIKFMKVN